jgi:hypothetical protein
MSSSPGYVAVDLAALGNVDIEVLGAGMQAGPDQRVLGLPFRIGRRVVGFGPGLRTDALHLPLSGVARHVIVAHRLLDPPSPEPGAVGAHVADYVMHFADGQTARVPIRARFEIAALATWGQLPFACVADQPNSLLPRWSGPWSEAGLRQTESNPGRPRAFFLWCWTNPRPDVPLSSLEVVPEPQPRFVIVGLTLGQADEFPFVRSGAVPVRIDLLEAEAAQAALPSTDLQLSVDRGVASYAYPLPRQPNAAAFLQADFAGWGEPQNPGSSPAYVEVAALPSATLDVQVAGASAGSVSWGELQQRRSVEAERVRLEIVEDGRNWVETVVLDAETGQPVPCRVHFRSIQGVPYQPHGHHAHVNSNQDTWHIDVGGDLRLGQITYAYTDGRCQGWLPRGEVLVDVARGYEYRPLRQRVTIAPGQRRLELRLQRWTDMHQRGWYSGDTHVHFLSTQGSLFEAQAEDLNVVNLLQSQWGSLFTNTEDFTGRPVSSADGRSIVWTNQENRQHMLGHLILLGLQAPVYPWCSDGPDEAELGGTLESTLSAWADACHAQGGTVIIPHFPNPNGEPATLVATGRADAVEMIVQEASNHQEYYRYLNAGYRLPLVGGTDKMSSAVAVGQYRTYVRIPSDEEFSYASWCRNLRLGRTFLSGGPLLELSVEGAQIGDTVRLPSGGGQVEVTASARSILPVHTLQLIQDGQVVAQTDATETADGLHALSLHATLRVGGSSWVCARAGGPGYRPLAHHDTWQRGTFAHTSPIYLVCGDGEWQRADASGLEYLLTLVEGSLRYMRDLSPQRPAEQVTHHHGEADHQAYLERPFREAQAALQARLAALRPQ